MEEQIKQFCEKLVARLECEFSGTATDIHVTFDKERSSLTASDDDGEPYVQMQVAFTGEAGYENVRAELERQLKNLLEARREQLEDLPLQKPYDIVFGLRGTDTEENLLTIDSDLIFLDAELMEGLSNDLDTFWESLSRE